MREWQIHTSRWSTRCEKNRHRHPFGKTKLWNAEGRKQTGYNALVGRAPLPALPLSRRDRLWPIPFWPIHFGSGVCHGGSPWEWGRNPEKVVLEGSGGRRVGPEGWRPEGWGALKCARFEFSGCRLKPRRPRSRRGFTRSPAEGGDVGLEGWAEGPKVGV